MPELWIPTAERRQVHAGWAMSGGPPRVVHHITYDSLRSDGSPGITLDNVTDYLNSKGYQPHFVIDPVDGRIIQLLPADVGGSALVTNNKTGTACIQIEWYFTPGVVRNGVRYNQLPDTPMHGLAEIMAMAASWGIPATAPLAPGDRNSNVWFNVAGHYGHFNVPGNDHSDPVCPIAAILARAGQAPPPQPPDDEESTMVLIWHKGALYLIADGKRSAFGLQPVAADALKAAGVKVGGNPGDDQGNLFAALGTLT